MTMALKPLVWATLALPLASAVHAEQRHYTGVAYGVDTGQVRYREEHWLFEDGGVPTRLVLYRCKSGQPFASKIVHYRKNAWDPDFELHDHRDGYLEGAEYVQSTWRVYVKENAASRQQEDRLPEHTNTVVDAGFDDYVQTHWDALQSGRDLTAAFLMPSRLAYVNVKLQPDGASTKDGVAVRRFRMKLDSWLGAIAPSISMVYSETAHRLLEFVGPSNIRDAGGKRQQVRIEFSPRDEPVPTSAQIQAAQRETLVDRCPDA